MMECGWIAGGAATAFSEVAIVFAFIFCARKRDDLMLRDKWGSARSFCAALPFMVKCCHYERDAQIF
jgi:hypothetical protein